MTKESLREKFKETLPYLQVLQLLANQRLEWMWRVVGCQVGKSFSKCVNSEDRCRTAARNNTTLI
ncbi:hypothetical protein EYF80_017415 [Liparis tanakae]|uniref:Uncharacterized protein n=1 Tax=Liparis tanakae TaxID=230148 RepID=A0A4Z2I2T0_9TELE|nr:hypothetical protein EYF80_017415 [Liparis tanakae]